MLIRWTCAYSLEPRDYHWTCLNRLKLFESSNCRELTNYVEFSKGGTASIPTFFFRPFPVFFSRWRVGFCWWFVGLTFPQICLLMQNWYALWVSLVCEELFFVFQQYSCFSLRFIGIEKFFWLSRISYASVINIKSMNNVADTPWTFPKRILAFSAPDYKSRISKKGWNFFFFLSKNFTKKGTVVKSILYLVQ